MIPAQLVDFDLELDVLTSIPRAPRTAAVVFVTTPATVFAFGPNRYLFAALRKLPTPNLRIDAAARWHVPGLIEALADFPRAGDPERSAARFYDALEHDAPLLPFGDRMLDRLGELHRRRRYWRSRPNLADLELDFATLDRAAALERAYLEAGPEDDVTALELELTTILPTP